MQDVPGIRWPIILGAAGFAAGFVGPMIFVPEANQGPLVGIFISGPAGVALGFIFYGLCSLLKVSAPRQWRLLLGAGGIGVLATLLAVQPSPARQGTIFEGEIASCAAPRDVEAKTLNYWDARISEVTWAKPRAGWREDMHATLADAPGVIVVVRLKRENSVFENRKPWNRGSLFATGWTETAGEKSFYFPEGSCDDSAAGKPIKGFESYDLNAVIAPPKTWPPTEVAEFLDASSLAEVPERFEALL